MPAIDDSSNRDAARNRLQAAVQPLRRSAARGPGEDSFQAIMARELARAPWFALSFALHAVAFLLASLFVGAAPSAPPRLAQAELVLPDAAQSILPETQPEETVDLQQAEEKVDLDEPQLATNEPTSKSAEPAFDPEAFAPGYEGIGMLAWRGAGKGKGGSGGSDDIFGTGSDALKRGDLRTTVSRLRESGLEIVFVFDSTGSMDRILDAAKRRIFRMVEVLHALVPRARIGIVTYRDRGKAEEYETRSVAVTKDVYRVMNFMHTIDAGGGGDFPEAVLAGLKVATTQRFLPESRRVVVLIGDAPPHKEDEKNLRAAVQAFARGASCVHAIAMNEGRGRAPNPETRRAFETIAQDGKGQFALLEGEDNILLQVMALAFGSQHRRDLDEIYALVDRRTQRTEVTALDAVQRGDVEAVERALRRDPVDDEVIKGAIKLPNPAVTRYLVEKLGDRGFPPHSRQACSYAVMQILELRQPPLDPEADQALSKREVEGLLRRAQK